MGRNDSIDWRRYGLRQRHRALCETEPIRSNQTYVLPRNMEGDTCENRTRIINCGGERNLVDTFAQEVRRHDRCCGVGLKGGNRGEFVRLDPLYGNDCVSTTEMEDLPDRIEGEIN